MKVSIQKLNQIETPGLLWGTRTERGYFVKLTIQLTDDERKAVSYLWRHVLFCVPKDMHTLLFENEAGKITGQPPEPTTTAVTIGEICML